MRYFVILLLGLVLMSCDPSRVYEDYNDLDQAFWHMDSVQRFSFQIEDAAMPYNLLATFRNASNYPYYNIYFQYTLKDSTDGVLLEELIEHDFFDSKTGEPLGSGLGDMFDHSVPLKEGFQFDGAGNYSLEIKQYMRLDTLPYLLSVGARVEKSE